jgi:hypothetical protein
VIRRSCDQASIAFEVNSVSRSETIKSGLPRQRRRHGVSGGWRCNGEAGWWVF